MSETMTAPKHSADQNLAATIGKSTLFGIIANGAQVGTRLVTIPFVIHHLGLDGYGIWSIIMVTAGYMRFGTAGIRSAFQRYVAEATETGHYENVNRLLSTGSISMLVLSVAGLLPLAVFSKTLAVAAGVPSAFLNAAAASIAVLATIYVITNFGAVFEAVVMGGQRVDLTRKVNTILTLAEAVAIILLLHIGYGLLAMTLVMGVSELIYISFCYKASHRIVPQIQIGRAHFTTSVFPELIRFAGSYQMVNILELLQNAILPIAILKGFGAAPAGVFAVATRIAAAALIAQDALVLPILSGGTMVFASGSKERSKLFLAKSFKATLAASMPPLACVATFGMTMILAWTGQADPLFRIAIWACAIAALFRAVSLLQLILYRASGMALFDNIRQILRIAAICLVASFSGRLGFNGVLIGMAVAELMGTLFMFYAMARTPHGFSMEEVSTDSFRILLATVLIIASGALASLVPTPWSFGPRMAATIQLIQITVGCLIMAWPAFALTKSLSTAERRSILDALRPGRKAAWALSE